ncbi:MAG: penicillin-binding protein 2, partial [Chlamydiia bacterium]|nr:penicillin-binding protein 2 [Chlamydiia bacterium]
REQRADLLQWWHPWARARRVARNAIYFTTDYQRSYPFGSLLGPVLHTIQDRKDDVTLQATPTGGLELQFNSLLSGKLGRRRLVRSPRNALETEDIIEAPENGADVYLTIDLGLQALCEREISKAVKDAGAQAGWAVMMDPSSGEILALAQYPYFDPARYREYYNDPDKAWMTKVKAITDAFEPGSTIKPLTMAVALEANREAVARKKAPYFTPTEKNTSSDGRFPGRGKPIKDVRTHSYLNMYMALQRSSNIYMARVMDRVVKGQGEGWYRDQLSRCFGFGAPTGIELPAESAGVLPTPGVASTGWSQATVHSMSFGYNLQVTSLQMLRAYGILANGGYWIDPTLVRKATKRHDDGTAEVVWSPPVERPARQKRVLHEDSVAEVVKGMRYASKAGGAAHRGDLPGYTQAAKTGTTKKIVDGAYSSEKYFSTFVGFAPVSDPKLVLLVAIDEPAKVYRPGQGMGYYGGVCAAPVFRKIATQALEY